MDDIDSTIFYDDENDFVEHDYPQSMEYEFDYEDLEKESLWELYHHCLGPSIQDAILNLLPIVVATIIFRLFIHSKYASQKLFHLTSIMIGFYVVYHYAQESMGLMILFVTLSYTTLYLPKEYRKGIGTFLPSLLVILYCEFSMEPVIWHKVRSLFMTTAMKAISIAADTIESHDLLDFYSYAGYILCPATCLFGPWVSYKDYTSAYYANNQSKWWILIAIGCGLASLFFLCMSNCLSHWLFMNNTMKWLMAYGDALAFRMSHYFISYAATAILIVGGFPLSMVNIVKPLHIEFPRSLVQVVIYWNIPMHSWLKTYVFRPSINRLGKFGAVTVTYLASALLHGLNFQLAAVLLSLGLYTYVEFQLRAVLASTFDVCIGSKQCPKQKCSHGHRPENNMWVLLTNLAFSGLTVFHLAYLGVMFDTSELQETGYNYSHTLDKWAQLGFASHWVVVATYCVYFLVK